jgi:membrane carboxypeptidase/penicillin-binding protein PbpC
VVTVWPEVYREWAQRAGLLEVGFVGPGAGAPRSGDPSRATSRSTSALTIVAPLAGAVYLVDPTLRRQFQALSLEASGGAPGARQWLVDGTVLGTATEGEPLHWPLEGGAHAFTVRDASGHTASTTVTVR